MRLTGVANKTRGLAQRDDRHAARPFADGMPVPTEEQLEYVQLIAASRQSAIFAACGRGPRPGSTWKPKSAWGAILPMSGGEPAGPLARRRRLCFDARP